MNKITTAALAGLVAVTATANASVSRWEGLGAVNAFVADVQDIFATLPHVVASHKNALYMELGQNNLGYTSGVWDGSTGNGTGNIYQDIAPGMAWGGAHLELGPGVLGVWVNRPYSEGGMDVAGNEFGNPSSTGIAITWGISVDQTLDLLYGFNLSEETTLGVHINRAAAHRSTKTETTAGTTSQIRDFSDLGLGLSVAQKGVGPVDLLEVGLTFNTSNHTNENKDLVQTDKYVRSGSDIDLRIGGDMSGDDGAFSRFEVGLNLDSNSTKNDPQSAPPADSWVENTNSGLGYNLGYAAGRSSENGMALVGLMLKSRSDSGEAKNRSGAGGTDKANFSEIRLEVSTGAEAKIKDWFSLRGGYSSDLFYSSTYKTEIGASGAVVTSTTVESERWYNGYPTIGTATFGTTITLGSFTLDGVLNQDLLYTGGFLVSGVPAGLSTQVSGTFAF